MTSEEKQEIINAVLAAIRTNSKTIMQLSPVSDMSNDDCLELSGGRRVSYGVLFSKHTSKNESNEAWTYLDEHKVNKARGLVEVHEAPVVFLDAMGALDGVTLSGEEGFEYKTDTKQIYDWNDGLFGPPKERAVYISKNNFKKYIWNGSDMEELKADECPLFVDYMEPVALATLPIGGSYYVPSSHKIAVKIDASSTKAYDPIPDALYYFRDKGMIYTWNPSTNKWVPAGCDIKVINNLTEGGEEDALSAEMGKVIRRNVNLILSRLGNYAFPGGKPTLDWGGGGSTTVHTVEATLSNLTPSNTIPAQVNDNAELTITLNVPSNLYVVDDETLSVTMDGMPLSTAAGSGNSITYTSGYASVTIVIGHVTGDVEISASAMTYVSSGLVSMFDGKNRGGTSGQWQDHIVSSRILTMTNCTENTDNVYFNGTDAKAVLDDADAGVDVGAADGTIECVFKMPTLSASVFNFPVTNHPKSGTRLLLCGLVNNGGTILATCFQTLQSGDSGVPNAWAITGDYTKSYLSMSNTRAYHNGVSLSRANSPYSGHASSNARLAFFSFKGANGTQYYRQGTLYCVRFYSGPLTVEEIARNYKVDQKRFNIS